MKRILCIFVLLFATLCVLTSCVDTTIDVTVNDDGYIVINGEQTEYQVKAEDVISVEGGYLVVNGIKTEHKVKTKDEISVEGGYLVVNGVKTEYEVKNDNHNFNDWELYNKDATNCEDKLYFRTCPDCSTVEWKQGKYEDHQFDEKYISDGTCHWNKCINCDAITEKVEHTIGDDSTCTVCGEPLGATEGIMYDVSDDGKYAMVVGYNGTAKIVKIAEEYNGLPVKEIYSGAFRDNKIITKLIIPDTVITIGSSAFYWCDSLTSVTIPDTVITIGNSAFFYCRSLTSITIPDSVTAIGEYMFYGCDSLIDVKMDNFSCFIDQYAFDSCDNITTEYNNGKYVCVNGNPYAIMINVTNTNLSTYEIHKDTKIIAANVFGGYYDPKCNRLTTIVIPDSVITISHYAFSNCCSLTSIAIPDSVITIGHCAFYDCDNLAKVTIGNSVTSIGDYAFNYCDNLKDVYYEGNEADWSKIEIGMYNYDLTSATKHYNHKQ